MHARSTDGSHAWLPRNLRPRHTRTRRPRRRGRGRGRAAADGADRSRRRRRDDHDARDSEGGSDVDEFEHVQIQLIAPAESDEKPNRIINLNAVDARRGSATIDLGPLERGTAVDVQLHVRELKPPRTRILRGDGIAKLRPDLVVAAVHAPEQTLSTRPIDVVADIDELNADTGAKATLTLMLGPTPLAEPKTITVPAGRLPERDLRGREARPTAMSAELTVPRGGRRAVRDRRDEQRALAARSR